MRPWMLVVAAATACSVPNVHFTAGDGGGDGSAIDAPSVAPGEYVWIRSLSQMSTQTITAGPAGVVTPGYLYSTANLGGTLLTSAGAADQVIAAFTEADATNLYGVRHGDVGSEFGLLGLLASNGLPIVSGVTGSPGPIDLGLGPVTGAGGTDGYIGGYANGVASWVQRIAGPGEDKLVASARGPGSTVYGAGFFEQTTNFNGGQLTSVGGRDIFVARFNVFGGTVDLTKQFGGVGRDEVSGGGCASSDTSSFVMSGFFDDTINFGGTAPAITASHGGLDMWIARLDSNGAGIWAVAYGGAGDDRDVSVVLDAAGDVYITGTFTTTITFGSKVLTAVGGTDHFIAKLDGTNGAAIWAVSFGTAGNETSGRIAVDSNGHVAFAGPLAGAFEGGTTAGGLDALVAEFSAVDGSPLWHHVYSTGGDDGGGGVAYGPTGALYASISIGGTYDFGHPVIGDPNPIGVLMRLAP